MMSPRRKPYARSAMVGVRNISVRLAQTQGRYRGLLEAATAAMVELTPHTVTEQ